jgi:hypothetical protein
MAKPLAYGRKINASLEQMDRGGVPAMSLTT